MVSKDLLLIHKFDRVALKLFVSFVRVWPLPSVLLHCFSLWSFFRWLFRDGLLPDKTYFVGFARSNLTVEDIKNACLPHMKVVYLRFSALRMMIFRAMFSEISVRYFSQVHDGESECLTAFFSRNSYLSGKYEDSSSFNQLSTHLSSLPGGADANRLFYLALPPTVYHHVTTNIRTHCMSCKWVCFSP